MSYRTLKVVKISDARLSTCTSPSSSILVYSTISMIGSHTYMLKEKPRMYVSTSIDDSARESNRAALDLSTWRTATIGDGFHRAREPLEGASAARVSGVREALHDDAVGARRRRFLVHRHAHPQQAWERTCADEVNLDGCEVANAGPSATTSRRTWSLRLTMRPTSSRAGA